jgi:hypothetical protein
MAGQVPQEIDNFNIESAKQGCTPATSISLCIAGRVHAA